MPSIKSGSLLTNIVLFVIMMLGLWLIGPKVSNISEYRVASSDIRFGPTDPTYLKDDYMDPATAKPYGQQFLTKQGDMARRYNFHFDESLITTQPAIYAPSSEIDVSLLVNGMAIDGTKDFDFAAPGFGEASLFADVPRLTLTPGNNRADLHYPASQSRAGLREIYLGPSVQLSKVHKQQQSWMSWLPQLGMLLSAAIVAIAFSGLIFGSFKNAYAVAGIAGAVNFIVNFAGSPRGDLLGDAWQRPAQMMALPVLLIALFFWTRVKKRVLARGHYYLPSMTIFAATGVAVLAASSFLPVAIRSPMAITTWGLLAITPLFLTWSLSSLLVDLDERKTLIDALELKLSLREEELDEKSRIIALEMRRRGILEERQRFTRDIHDGIGGQLLSLLLRVKTGKIGMDKVAQDIQSGINDLRLVVDAMDHGGENLSAALAVFRNRAVRQLEAAEMKLVWEQSADLDFSFPATKDILNLYRLMQEAVSNAIRHSGGDMIKIKIGEPNGGLSVSITDNGKGFDMETVKGGKGLSSMSERTAQLSGGLDIRPGDEGKGTEIHLVFPQP